MHYTCDCTGGKCVNPAKHRSRQQYNWKTIRLQSSTNKECPHEQWATAKHRVIRNVTPKIRGGCSCIYVGTHDSGVVFLVGGTRGSFRGLRLRFSNEEQPARADVVPVFPAPRDCPMRFGPRNHVCPFCGHA